MWEESGYPPSPWSSLLDRWFWNGSKFAAFGKGPEYFTLLMDLEGLEDQAALRPPGIQSIGLLWLNSQPRLPGWSRRGLLRPGTNISGI